MLTRTLYLYTETPLHVGTGSGLSSVDLPIQRERATHYPMIQASGVKGKLRAAFEDTGKALTPAEQEKVNIVFGPPSTNGTSSDHAGALVVGDARILLFPVRSLNGVFAYTTSYDVLNRFKRDIGRIQTENGTNAQVKDIPEMLTGQARVTTNSEVAPKQAQVTTESEATPNGPIVLEEFSFPTQADAQVDAIADWLATSALPKFGMDYWQKKLRSSLVILPNDVFRDFARYATEVITRVRIDQDKKTVARGALWTEEHLPTDTLMYVPIYANKARKQGTQLSISSEEDVLNYVATLNNTYLQLGGDETVGRGLVRIRLSSDVPFVKN